MNIEELLIEAMKLGLEARAKLAQRLILSLDIPTESEVEDLWIKEAERRLQELLEKKVTPIPAEEVIRRAMKEIS